MVLVHKKGTSDDPANFRPSSGYTNFIITKLTSI